MSPSPKTRTFRIPDQTWSEIEALAEALQDNPELATFGQVSAALVVRLALAAGLPVIRERYGCDTAESRPSRKVKPAALEPEERQDREEAAARALAPKRPARPARPKRRK